ncbi:MAG TPA: RDD family protein [Steroidobacteraceae bacterium]|nr:RDD family protein [Steroidobacteraceae bacterium]
MSAPRYLKYLVLVGLCALVQPTSAQNAAQGTQATAPEIETPESPEIPRFRRHYPQIHHDDNSLVSIGHDATLDKGAMADDVVAVFGSATSEGAVTDGVVSVFGDTHVTGSVGDSAVAVFGDTYVDGKIGDSVVAVLGNVVLGPNADIAGAVVVIGGTVTRDPAAIVHGGIQRVLPSIFGFHWMRPWIVHCLLYGRVLAFASGLEWAWIACLCFLGLYLLLALIFRDGVERCVQTLETHPARSVLAAILVVLFSPWLILLLLVTVIGILAVPFVLLGLLCVALFGKAVVLAWLGHRCLAVRGEQPPVHTVLAVLVGGIIVTALYLVPVLGVVVFNLVGVLGVGVVIYTMMLVARASRREQPAVAAAAAAAGGTAAFATATAPPDSGPSTGAGPSGPTAGEPPPGAAAAAAGAARATPVVSSALPRAGFWIRIAALLIDALLVGAVLAFVHHSTHLELLALAAYGAIMWKLKGTTIGGIVCGLCVVRMDDRPLDWPTAIVRALSCFLSLAVFGLGFIWIAFDDERQGWHDKIAGTVVVRVPQGVSLL